jgi:hypothetical protein
VPADDIKVLEDENNELCVQNGENSTNLIALNNKKEKLIVAFNKQTDELSLSQKVSQNERDKLGKLNEELEYENELLKTENDKLNEIREKYNEIMQKRYEAKADEARKLNELNQELEEEHNAWEEGRKETGKQYLKNTISNLNYSNLDIYQLDVLSRLSEKELQKILGIPSSIKFEKRKVSRNLGALKEAVGKAIENYDYSKNPELLAKDYNVTVYDSLSYEGDILIPFFLINWSPVANRRDL